MIHLLASRALSMLKKITFYFIFENVLLLCCHHLCTISIRDISDVEYELFVTMGKKENMRPLKMVSRNEKLILVVSIASCVTEANPMKHPSNGEYLARCQHRHRHHPHRAPEWMFYFIWISIMASRHTMKSCQFINSMPLSLSSKDKVRATATTQKSNE